MAKYIWLGVFAVLAGVLAGSYISAYNSGNSYEQRIIAAWENNENVLAQYGQKITEAAQITDMQRDDVADILTGGLEARYGTDGSRAAFQWIQEQNPNVDSTVYVKIQQLVEAGRNEFKVAQTQLVDVKRGYRTDLGSFWRGTWLGIAGYPRINVGFRGGPDDYKPITTRRASDAFESGVEEAIQIRN